MKRRVCAFCGRDDVKISNEHVWPNWARKLFPPEPSTMLGARDRTQAMGTVNFRIAPDDMGLKVNAVCRVDCNNGWMRELENRVEPLLTAPIRDGEAATFSQDQRRTLATWTLKTAMALEFTALETPFFTAEERDALRRTGSPGGISYVVWTTRYVGLRYMSVGFATRAFFDTRTEHRTFMVPSIAATISLGQFVVQLLALRPPPELGGILVPHPAGWDQKVLPLWPSPSEPSSWRPTQALDDDEIARFARRFAGL